MKLKRFNRLLMLLVAFMTMSVTQVWGAETTIASWTNASRTANQSYAPTTNDANNSGARLKSECGLTTQGTGASASAYYGSWTNGKAVIISGLSMTGYANNSISLTINLRHRQSGTASFYYSTDGSSYPSSANATQNIDNNSKDYKISSIPNNVKSIKVAISGNSSGNLWLGNVTVAGEPAAAAPINVVLSRNGATTNFNGQTAPFALPAANTEADACTGWVFKGWTKTSSVNSTTAPEFITSVSESCTVYAVYGKTEGGGSTTTTYTLNGNWTTDNGNWTKTAGNNLSSTLASGKYGLNSSSSTATSPVSYTGISGVVITGSKSGSGSGTWSIQYGSGSTWTDLLSSSNSKAVANSATWTPSSPVNGSLKVTMSRTAGNVYIASIAVTYTTATTTYKTAPECGPATYTASVAGGLENGSIN